ncbi:MAG: prolipoprotein diacylglyceryl transferase family protein [Pirellulales bacterium]
MLIAWAACSVLLLGRLAWKQRFNADTLGYIPVLAVLGVMIGVVLPALSEEQGLPIRGYGVMLLVAFVSGVSLAVWRARRMGLDTEIIFSLAFWVFIAGIVGARLFYVIEYWEKFKQDTVWKTLVEVVKVTEGGLVVYGSAIGVGIALLLFVRRHKLPGLALADLIAPSTMLGLALGRLGCFLNGCCFGDVCQLPWAVQFPWQSPPHVRQIERGQLYLHGLQLPGTAGQAAVVEKVEPGSPAERAGVRAGERIVRVAGGGVDERVTNVEEAQAALLSIHVPGDPITVFTGNGQASKTWTVEQPLGRSLPIHPAQLYSAIDAGLLCLFLLAYYPYRRRDGEVFALLITIHPVSRFLLEVIRTDETAVFGTGLSISQNVSLLMLAAAAGLWVWLLRRPRGSAWPLQVTAAARV